MVLWRAVLLGVCVRMSLCKLECRSAMLCVLGVLSFLIPRIWGHVRSPLVGGSASVKIISRGGLSFHNSAGGCVRFVVVCDSRVRFYLAYMCAVSHVISCADDIVCEL